MPPYPFWLVTEHRDSERIGGAPCDDPHALHAFTSTDKLAEFLDAFCVGGWKVDLIAGADDLILALAGAHQAGASALCFDAGPDHSGGSRIILTDILPIIPRAGSAVR